MSIRVPPHPSPYPSPLPAVLQLGGSSATNSSALFHNDICLPKYRPSWKIPTAFIIILIIVSHGGACVPWHTQNPKTQDKRVPFLQGWSGSRIVLGERQTVFKIFHSFPHFPRTTGSKSRIEMRGENRETIFRSKHNGSRGKRFPAEGWLSADCISWLFSDVKTPIRGHIIAHHGNRNYIEGEERQDYSNKNGEWGRS